MRREGCVLLLCYCDLGMFTYILGGKVCTEGVKYETQLVQSSCEANSASRYRLPKIYNVYTSEQMLINIFHHSYRHLDNLLVFIYFVRAYVHCSHGFLLESIAFSVLLHYK